MASALGDQFPIITEVVKACADGTMLINGKQCLEVLKAALPTTTKERMSYNLAAPALLQWQVEVRSPIFFSIYSESNVTDY